MVGSQQGLRGGSLKLSWVPREGGVASGHLTKREDAMPDIDPMLNRRLETCLQALEASGGRHCSSDATPLLAALVVASALDHHAQVISKGLTDVAAALVLSADDGPPALVSPVLR